MPKVHPTAIVHPTAVLSDGVEIGAYSIVEADVVIGPGTVLRDHAILRRYTTIGQNNIVDSYAVLGGLPQDLKFNPRTASYLRVGDDNVFREGVTISRATGEGEATVVGNRTYWMTTAHAGHSAVVEDDCILVNGSALAGHTVLGRGAILRIIEAAAKMINFPMEKVYLNIDRYGNTSAVTIPIALDEISREGKLKVGNLILMCSFGTGVTWGGAVVRW